MQWKRSRSNSKKVMLIYSTSSKRIYGVWKGTVNKKIARGKIILSKYNANKIVIDGYNFDSKAEGQFYENLKEFKSKELILNFELQPKYELQPKFTKDGINHRQISYIADFLIYELDGSMKVIDVKGMAVPVAILKRKMFNYKYPELKLTWIVRNLKYGGWVEYDELKRLRRKAKNDKQL